MFQFFKRMFSRKTVSDIVAPLSKMREELYDAVTHHNTQVDLHQELVSRHQYEATKATTLHGNIAKLIGAE